VRTARAVAALGALGAGALAAAVTIDELDVARQRGHYSLEANGRLDATPESIYAVLTDYEQIPRFMPDIRRSSVLERSEGMTVVEQEAVARLMMFSKRIHLILEIQNAPGVIRFRDRCGKSFARYEGGWTIAERDGQAVVRYDLTATPSFDVPEFLLKRLLKRDALQMIERLQTEMTARSREPNRH